MISILPQFLLIEMPGGGELLIILVVVLLLFGGKKIPELMRGLGKGIREFNDAKGKITSELEEGIKEKDNRHPTQEPSYTHAETVVPVSETTHSPHRDTPLSASGLPYKSESESSASESAYLPHTETKL